MKKRDLQRELFELPPRELAPAPFEPAELELGAVFPPEVRLGGMSWSYPGWAGSVYGSQASPRELAEHGLTAYSKHPLLGAVEIDRSYYEPLPLESYRAFAAQVPERFRFAVKLHEDCVIQRFPGHPRYGKRRGALNPRYLDSSYAREVLEPIVEGLGDRLGVVVLQFPPQPDTSEPEAFAARLERFLAPIARIAPLVVEVRNPELVTPEYGAALVATGALHCHNVWTTMPSVLAQARAIPPRARSPLVIRWLLRHGDPYGEAAERFAPFDRLASEDPHNREQIAELVSLALEHEVPVFVLINNKAEGCAPRSAVELARAIVRRRARL